MNTPARLLRAIPLHQPYPFMRNHGRTKEMIQTLPCVRMRELASRGQIQLIPRGGLVMIEGERGDSLVIVLEGCLRVFSSSGGDRPREVTHGLCGRGDMVGEMSLDGGPRSASVVALQPTWCSIVLRTDLMEFIREEPLFVQDMLGAVVGRARLATHALRQAFFTDTYSRLRELLLRNALPLPDGRLLVKDRMTHALMAQQIGASREMVSRLFKDLMEGGYVSRNERRQYVLNPPIPSRW